MHENQNMIFEGNAFLVSLFEILMKIKIVFGAKLKNSLNV